PERTRSTLRAADPPIENGQSIRWSCEALKFSGEWIDPSRAIHQTLIEDDRGVVNWSCIKPSSQSSLSIDGRTMRGLGYVERLEMTRLPWDLPIDLLRWGRFLAEGLSLVWIDWAGPQPLRRVFRNGEAIDVTSVPDNGPDIPGVAYCDRRVLRDGPVAG